MDSLIQLRPIDVHCHFFNKEIGFAFCPLMFD